MRNYIRFSAFFLLLVSCFAFAVSSEEAKTTASSYLVDQQQTVALVPYGPKPLTDEISSYWLIYFMPTAAAPGDFSFSYTKMAIVSDSGVIVTDEPVLYSLFRIDYLFDVENKYLKANKLDYGNLRSAAEATKTQVVATRSVANQVSSSIAKRKPDSPALEKVSDLVARLDSIEEKTEALQLLVDQGLLNEDSFSQAGVLSSYESAVSNYNATFDALLVLVDELTAYSSASQDSELYSMLVSEEVNALGPASAKVSEQFPYTRAYLEGPKGPLTGFSSRMAAAESSINDAVSNSVFRKASVDARNDYDTLSKSILSDMLSKYKSEKARFSACGISESATRVKNQWEDVQLVMENPGAELEDYQAVSANASEIRASLAQIEAKYTSCFEAGTPTPQPPDYSGQIQILVIVLIVIVAAVIYLQQKKRQEDSEFSQE